MGKPVDLTQETFKDTVEKGGLVLIDWWAPWCGPCRSFGPIYETVAAKHDDVVFAKINTEEQPELGAAFEIRSIPTLMVFRDRVLLFSQAGALPMAMLEELVEKAKSLDMEEIRKEIEAQQAQQSRGPEQPS